MSITSLSKKIPLLPTDPLYNDDLGYDSIKLGDSLATTMAVGEEDGIGNGDTSLPDLSDFLKMPLLPLYDIPSDDSIMTTMAVGEEDGGLTGSLPEFSDFLEMPVFDPKNMPKLGDLPVTTQAVGEEDNINSDNPLTDFLSFLGNSVFDISGEMGVNDDMLTTQAVGEEDNMTEGHSSIAVGEFNPSIPSLPSKKSDITSAIMGEEDVFGSVTDDDYIPDVK